MGLGLTVARLQEVHDGWDVALGYVQRARLVPAAFLQPVISRVRNIGRTGLNVRGVRLFVRECVCLRVC
jgi:hypothetical protein